MSENEQSSESSVVLRLVVYGAASAGKTATALALGSGLGQPVVSPEWQLEGPTPYFDWMEYVGGRHGGKPIRTQLVTVAGAGPAARRVSLLLTADVVLFVADTTAEGIDASVASLAEAQSCLVALEAETGAPPPSIVIQANKRDVDNALSLDEVRSRLGIDEDEAVIETVACEGQGVRQAFVFAVRVGLEHLGWVGERMEVDQSAEELLDALQLADVDPGQAVADQHHDGADTGDAEEVGSDRITGSEGFTVAPIEPAGVPEHWEQPIHTEETPPEPSPSPARRRSDRGEQAAPSEAPPPPAPPPPSRTQLSALQPPAPDADADDHDEPHRRADDGVIQRVLHLIKGD